MMGQQEQDEKPVQSGSGPSIQGDVTAGRDFVGRDLTVHGDQVEITGTIGNVSAGAQVAVGNRIQQLMPPPVITPPRQLTAREQSTLENLFTHLEASIDLLIFDEPKRGMSQQQLAVLRAELTKYPEPLDTDKMQAAAIWLLTNLPTLAGDFMNFFTNPVVSKLIEISEEKNL